MIETYKRLNCWMLVLCLCMLAESGFAQRGFGRGGFGGQPSTLGIHYTYVDPSGIQQVNGEFMQLRDLARVPGASPLSYVSTAMLAAGARFGGTLDSAEFRWRAGLMDANLNRRLMVIGLTLLDFDRSGPLFEDFRWIQGRLGLGKTLRHRKLAISGQIYGVVGRTRIEMGREYYQEFGRVVDSTLSGLETGFSVGVGLRYGRKLVLKGSYFDRVIVKSPEPHFTGFTAEANYYPGSVAGNLVRLFVLWRFEETEINASDIVIENTFISAGVRVTLRPRRRDTSSIWD